MFCPEPLIEFFHIRRNRKNHKGVNEFCFKSRHVSSWLLRAAYNEKETSENPRQRTATAPAAINNIRRQRRQNVCAA